MFCVQALMMRDCAPPLHEKVLVIALYLLAHCNSWESMAPALNVGKTTANEAMQDVVNWLYELRNHYIKFPVTPREIAASTDTFPDLSDWRYPYWNKCTQTQCCRLLQPVWEPWSYNTRNCGRTKIIPLSCGRVPRSHAQRELFCKLLPFIAKQNAVHK